jgi:hypothetical protein
MMNQKLSCPLCNSQDIIKFGFVHSRALKTYGKKLAQKYQCKKCLTTFAPNHPRQYPFFPKWLRNFVREEIQKDPMLSCQDLSDVIYTKFQIPVNRTIIYNWIAITGNIKIQYRLQKNWRTRRQHFGNSGMSRQWHEKRKLRQKEVWQNPEYRKYMSEAHKHPQHDSEIVSFCFSLKDKGLSLRAIAREANKKFQTKIAHDTVSHWFSYPQEIMCFISEIKK